LAIPLVIAISTSLGAQNGFLVKDRLALERARDLDMVVFDKTGTLTRGAPALSGVAVASGVREEDLFARAAAVEADSEHPLAKVIVAEAERRGLTPLSATAFEALPGRGAPCCAHWICHAWDGWKHDRGWASEGLTPHECRIHHRVCVA
jgi:Cu2+-exporting ATPase